MCTVFSVSKWAGSAVDWHHWPAELWPPPFRMAWLMNDETLWTHALHRGCNVIQDVFLCRIFRCGLLRRNIEGRGGSWSSLKLYWWAMKGGGSVKLSGHVHINPVSHWNYSIFHLLSMCTGYVVSKTISSPLMSCPVLFAVKLKCFSKSPPLLSPPTRTTSSTQQLFLAAALQQLPLFFLQTTQHTLDLD